MLKYQVYFGEPSPSIIGVEYLNKSIKMISCGYNSRLIEAKNSLMQIQSLSDVERLFKLGDIIRLGEDPHDSIHCCFVETNPIGRHAQPLPTRKSFFKYPIHSIEYRYLFTQQGWIYTLGRNMMRPKFLKDT